MGCFLGILGFALGFGIIFWLEPIISESLFGHTPPWWERWGISVFFGLFGSGYLSYLWEKGKQDDTIRRAEVKRAEDYLSKRKDRRKDEDR